MNYYPTGTSDPGQYAHQYPQEYGPSYHQHPQDVTTATYHPGQNVSGNRTIVVIAVQL